MEKQIFKKGDRVFVANYGWGKIINERDTTYTISFDNKNVGTRIPRNLVSFTEYTLQGFSQEKPINYEDYIGKWGKFKSRGLKRFVIDKLKSVEFHEKNSFCAETDRTYYYEFEPLTEEQIKVLGLE